MPLYNIKGRTVLFIHIPKNAGTAVEELLAPYLLGFLNRKFDGRFFPCSPQHFHAEILRDAVDLSAIDFSFLISRNPLDRIVSEYRFRQTHFGEERSFENWVDSVFHHYRKNPFYLDNHIRPQVDFLLDEARVFRLEDGLNNLFREVSQKLNFDVKKENFQRINESHASEVFVSEVTLNKITSFYEADFKQLKYRVDDSESHNCILEGVANN